MKTRLQKFVFILPVLACINNPIAMAATGGNICSANAANIASLIDLGDDRKFGLLAGKPIDEGGAYFLYACLGLTDAGASESTKWYVSYPSNKSYSEPELAVNALTADTYLDNDKVLAIFLQRPDIIKGTVYTLHSNIGTINANSMTWSEPVDLGVYAYAIKVALADDGSAILTYRRIKETGDGCTPTPDTFWGYVSYSCSFLRTGAIDYSTNKVSWSPEKEQINTR